MASGARLRRCDQQAVPERGDGGLIVDVLSVSHSRQGGILALVTMLLRAVGTYKRRAMHALLVRDAASALHRVAGPAVVPLLMSVAAAASSDVDGLVVVQPVAVCLEAGESQASLVQAGHLRSFVRFSSNGTWTNFATTVTFGLAHVGARATVRVVGLEPWSFGIAG